MDISHIVYHDEGGSPIANRNSLIQLNDPKGKLLKQFFQENSKVFHTYMSIKHANDFNCGYKLSYAAHAKGLGLSDEIHCPVEVANINSNLGDSKGFALRMRKSYFDKIRSNEIVIKVQGSDTILYYTPGSRIPHIWVPCSSRIFSGRDLLGARLPSGPIMPHNCKW